MKKIHYLLLIVVLFSCSKTMDVVKQPTPITGSGTVNLLSIELVSQDTISISKKYQPAKPANAEGQKETGSQAVEDTNPNKTAKRLFI